MSTETDNVKRRGGRPKKETSEKKEHFNLQIKPETREALNRAVGRIQAETGKRVTVTGLILQLIEEYLAKQQEG